MRTVRQIREELYWAKDNGLTTDQIEALEVEMLEVEAKECEIEQPKELTHDELVIMVSNIIPHRSRFSTKAWYARSWFFELSKDDQQYTINHFKEIYNRNTAEKFRVGLPK